jgi:diketogulonate reductase-like aldo/keto reductase
VRRPFGSTGRRVPRIGLGTWNLEQARRADAVRALRRGLELGLTHVDTAEMYGSGAVERIVGEALRDVPREEVFLATKVLPSNASRAGTLAAAQQSLERLGVDAIGLYLLHWPGDHPLEDTIAAFEELAARGTIRAWGVSNFDADELRRAVALAGPGRIACNQVLYHLRERAIEHRVLPACEELGVALVAYSPFGAGDFPKPGTPEGAVLAGVARDCDATPHQVALAFLTRRESVFAIPKSSQVAHVEEIAGALELELDLDAVARIDAAFPLGPDRAGVPML